MYGIFVSFGESGDNGENGWIIVINKQLAMGMVVIGIFLGDIDFEFEAIILMDR